MMKNGKAGWLLRTTAASCRPLAPGHDPRRQDACLPCHLLQRLQLPKTNRCELVPEPPGHQILIFARECPLLNRAGDGRKCIVGVASDQANRAHHQHQDDGQHDRIFSDVLALVALTELANEVLHVRTSAHGEDCTPILPASLQLTDSSPRCYFGIDALLPHPPVHCAFLWKVTMPQMSEIDVASDFSTALAFPHYERVLLRPRN